jgi:hypothetical protein
MELAFILPPWCAPVSNTPPLGWDRRSEQPKSRSSVLAPAAKPSAAGDRAARAAAPDNAAIGRDGGLDQPAPLIGTADIAGVSRNLSAGRAQGRFRFVQLLSRAC